MTQTRGERAALRGGVDRAVRGGDAGGVVVEGERDVADAVVGELLEEAGARGGSAERRDVLDAVGAEDVDVEDAFDEEQVDRVGARSAS